ncbi:hypothetical protein GCM10010306_085290 [Streptomyces umbrinus]|nr:hypothetical protein GCM10010306_085290 [Streptomyces umbrinus]
MKVKGKAGMRIGDLAHETGVSRRLLRYYEEQGLLRPVRLGNGYRQYVEADVATVHHIRAMLAAGLSTAVIARLVHCVRDKDELRVPSDCPTFIGELRRERTRITEAISQLESSRHLLDAVLDTAPRDGEDPSPGAAPTKSRAGRVPGQGRGGPMLLRPHPRAAEGGLRHAADGRSEGEGRDGGTSGTGGTR